MEMASLRPLTFRIPLIPIDEVKDIGSMATGNLHLCEKAFVTVPSFPIWLGKSGVNRLNTQK